MTFLASLPGDRQVTLSWGRPLSDGGAAITKYEYRYKTDGDYGNWRELLTIVDALSFARTVSGLTNGTPHTFQARAVNSVGGGAESNESTATPRTTPGAPQTLEASAGDAEVTLSWLAPSSDGGATNHKIRVPLQDHGQLQRLEHRQRRRLGPQRDRPQPDQRHAPTPSRCARGTPPAAARHPR